MTLVKFSDFRIRIQKGVRVTWPSFVFGTHSLNLDLVKLSSNFVQMLRIPSNGDNLPQKEIDPMFTVSNTNPKGRGQGVSIFPG